MAGFITRWTVAGGGAANTITLPLINDGVFNCTVSWGDGTPNSTILAYNDAARIHNYALDGTYDVTITGECPSWSFGGAGDRLKIVSILNWGDIADFGGFGLLASGFRGCSNLTSIGVTGKILAKVGLTSFYQTFLGCSGITAIPTGLFDNCVNLATNAFYATFHSCSSLTTVPVDLFRYNVLANANAFYATFYACTSLTTVPADIFRYNTLVGLDGFKEIFVNCTNLSSVPVNLFRYNTLTTSFSGCFYGCTKLTVNKNIFYADGEQGTRFLNKSVNFLQSFYRTSFTGIQGTAPDLWNCSFGTGTAVPTDCFTGAGNSLTSLTNYNEIPTTWGGPYTGLGYWTSRNNIIQGLKNEGVLRIYHDHRSGTLYDYSGNGRTGVPNSANFFTKRGINTRSVITITNDATLQSTTTGTLVVRQRVTRSGSTSYFAKKNNQFQFTYSYGLNKYDLYINGTAQTLTYTGLVGDGTHAVEFDSVGGTPKGYFNGILLGNYSGVLTSVADASNLFYGFASSDLEPQQVEYFLFISRKLTAAEHQELYQQLQALS